MGAVLYVKKMKIQKQEVILASSTGKSKEPVMLNKHPPALFYLIIFKLIL